MREIMFKAKRIDNGKWVEGHLIQSPYMGEVRSWISTPEDKTRLRAIATYYGDWRAVEVSTDTICQYTGLNDKNGNKIWENDIMVAHFDDIYPEDESYTQVIWYQNGFYTKEKRSPDREPLDDFDSQNYTVCGNIFDNAELLDLVREV